MGFYDGLVGPGTGTFLILLFTMILGLEAVLASGTAKLVNLTSNLAALIPLMLAGKVIFGLGIPAAVCAVAGNLLGAAMTLEKGRGVHPLDECWWCWPCCLQKWWRMW